MKNCSEYSPTADYCKICNQDYWLDVNQLICHPKPEGLLGCSQYGTKNVCSKCMKEFYLESGKCTILPSTSSIKGCIAYNGQQ